MAYEIEYATADAVSESIGALTNLIEAKAHANRIAFDILLQHVATVTGQDVSPVVHAIEEAKASLSSEDDGNADWPKMVADELEGLLGSLSGNRN